MVEYLQQYSEKEVAIRLSLAGILVSHAGKPLQAIKVLEKINSNHLDQTERDHLYRLQRKAARLHDEKPFETADEDW